MESDANVKEQHSKFSSVCKLEPLKETKDGKNLTSAVIFIVTINNTSRISFSKRKIQKFVAGKI